MLQGENRALEQRMRDLENHMRAFGIQFDSNNGGDDPDTEMQDHESDMAGYRGGNAVPKGRRGSRGERGMEKEGGTSTL
jgi:hypothetical protein